jgi:hypothetical protein
MPRDTLETAMSLARSAALPLMALALLFNLAGCAFFAEMQERTAATVSAGSTGCDPDQTRISGLRTTGSTRVFRATCNGKSFVCTELLDDKGGTKSVDCSDAQ